MRESTQLFVLFAHCTVTPTSDLHTCILVCTIIYHTIIPSYQDEPAVKATFAVTMTIPQRQHALSNMPELSSTHLSNGRKRVVFDVTPVMSTYLLAFAVGVWDVISDKTK